MSELPILQVAVNAPLSRLFDYLPPSEGGAPLPGCRVLVPFGRQRQIGMVIAHAAESELPNSKLRRMLSAIDDEQVLSEQDLWLIRFTSDYYHHPLGEVVAAAMPALLRQGKPLNPVVQRPTWKHCTSSKHVSRLGSMRSKSPKRNRSRRSFILPSYGRSRFRRNRIRRRSWKPLGPAYASARKGMSCRTPM